MMKLKRLRLKGFKSFAEESTVEFPDSGLVLIRGINHSTNDPSGTGKSSLLLAVAYALDMCPQPATELSNWDGAPLQVELTLDTPNGEVVISRGVKNSIKTPSKTVTGAKAVQEELPKLLGVSSDILKAMTYRVQREFGLFINLKDSGKKDLLMSVLKLNKIEEAVEKAELQLKKLVDTQTSERKRLEWLRSAVTSAKAFSTPTLEDTEGLEAEVAEAELVLKKKQVQLETARQEHQEQVAACKESQALVNLRAKLVQVDEFIKRELAAFQAKTTEFRASQTQANKSLVMLKDKESRVVHLNGQIAQGRSSGVKMERGVCPTCDQPWGEAKAIHAVNSHNLEKLEAEVKDLRDVVAKLALQKTEFEELLKSPPPQSPMLERLNLAKLDIIAEIKQLEYQDLVAPGQAAKNAVEGLRLEVESKKTALNAARKMLDRTVAHNQSVRVMIETNLLNIQKAQKEFDECEKALATVTADVNAENDFIALLGNKGFLSAIFDDVLVEIEQATNERLALLANVSHVTVKLKSSSTTEKGTVKKTIETVVYVDGHEASPRAGLSGGMLSSVETQLDLALSAVIQRRTGAMPGWALFDEAFYGPGNVTKEAVMEVFKQYAADKLIVVIDHSSELKEVFTQFIDVHYKDGKSWVESPAQS